MISVVIPFRDEAKRLASTVRSIIATRSAKIGCEIIIVDDASVDGYRARLPASQPGVTIRVLRLNQRAGVPRARNYGARAARGDVLFMTDSHVWFCRNWDRIAMEHIRRDRVIAATITDTSGSFKGYGCSLVVPFMGTRWNRDPFRQVTPIQIASASGTVLKASLFKEIGGYDDGMISYGAAEPEFSVRAYLSGAEVVSVPRLEIRHRFKQKAERDVFVKKMRTFMIHNNLRFGLLYLSNGACLQMIRYYAMLFPAHIQKAFALLERSDVWNRREFLREKLRHDFAWYVRRFRCKDQIGGEIL